MSKVQICNRGLSTYLGEGRINSFTEDTPAAVQCSLHYDDTLQVLIQSHHWIFAKGRKVLAQLTNDRPDEWAYKYAVPSDAQVIQWVNDAASAAMLSAQNTDPTAPYEPFGQFIYTNAATASCEYTQLVTDTTLFPAHFKKALSAAIAGNVAMPITEDTKRAQFAMQQASEALDEAICIDENQSPPKLHSTVPSWMSDRGIS